MPDEAKVPEVFISYAWTSPEHIDWVENLATRLNNDRVQVHLDLWDLKEGQNKYVFMEKCVTDPNILKVLIICNKQYAEKADKREGGVGTETVIISPEVYEKVNQQKFIPLIRERDDDGKEIVPVYLKGRIYIDFSDDEKFDESYDQLLRNILDKPLRKRPPLGERHPAHLTVENAPHIRTGGMLQRIKDSVQRDRPNVHLLIDQYFETFLEGLEDYRIQFLNSDYDTWEKNVSRTIESFLPQRDDLIDFLLFVTSHVAQPSTFESIHAFLERLLAFDQSPKKAQSVSNLDCDNFQFIINEVFLYVIAVLLKNRKYEEACSLIEGQYHRKTRPDSNEYVTSSVSGFDHHVETVEKLTAKRLNVQQGTAFGCLMVQRATHPKVKFTDLYQADQVIFLKRWFPSDGERAKWWPRLMAYANEGGQLELFAKAGSARGMVAVKQLFRVKDVKDLVTKMSAASGDPDFNRVFQNNRFWRGYNLEEIYNLNELTAAANR